MRRSIWSRLSRLKDALQVVTSIAVCLLVAGYLRGQHTVGAYSVATVQQNVDARYDDCQQLNGLRLGLRSGVKQSRTTAPLLYKLVPALDTSTVKTLVQASWARELQEYAKVDCNAYARRAIPHGDQHHYHVP
jgi:hypothetical protein